MPDVKLHFSRKVCQACAKESIFRGNKCLSCGHIGALYIKKRVDYAHSVKREQQRKQMKKDRIAFYQARAAENRKKWEGK